MCVCGETGFTPPPHDPSESPVGEELKVRNAVKFNELEEKRPSEVCVWLFGVFSGGGLTPPTCVSLLAWSVCVCVCGGNISRIHLLQTLSSGQETEGSYEGVWSHTHTHTPCAQRSLAQSYPTQPPPSGPHHAAQLADPSPAPNAASCPHTYTPYSISNVGHAPTPPPPFPVPVRIL